MHFFTSGFQDLSPAKAALIASAITAFASLGVTAFAEYLRGKHATKVALHAAVNEVLTRSLSFGLRASTLRTTVEIRSGLAESFDVLMYRRKPLDPMELHTWFAEDWTPLSAALSEILTRGDQQLIRHVKAVASCANDLFAMGTSQQPAPTIGKKLRRAIIGERWTQEALDEYQQAERKLGTARNELIDYTRKKRFLRKARQTAAS